MDQNNENIYEEDIAVDEAEEIIEEATPETKVGGELTEEFLSALKAEGGYASQLYKRVTRVNIMPVGIRNAFTHFLSMSTVSANGFHLYDMLGLYDKCTGSGKTYAAPAEAIILITGDLNIKAEEKFASRCIDGLYSLILRSHGLALDIGDIPLDKLMHSRFIVCSERKSKSILRKLAEMKVTASVIGMAACDESISIYSGQKLLVSAEKSDIIPECDEPICINIDNSFCELFKQTLIEAGRYISLLESGFGEYLEVPYEQSAETLFVTLLAVFAAQKTYRRRGVMLRFGSRIRAVSRNVNIPVGSFAYLYAPACDNAGYPSTAGCVRLNSALREFAALGKSIGVLPVVGSVDETLKNAGITLVCENNISLPETGGAVIVFVNRRDTYGRFLGTVGGEV